MHSSLGPIATIKPSMTSLLAIVLATLPTLISAQTNPNCFALSPNSICGSAYAGYSITPGSQSGVPVYYNEETFNVWVSANLANDAAMAEVWVETMGCSASTIITAVESMRYRVSRFCARTVQAAVSACANPNVGPSLCNDECGILAGRINAAINDANLCPPTNNNAFNERRQTVMNNYATWCDEFRSFSSSSGIECVRGVPNEDTFCGFSSESKAISLCPSNPDSDICCAQSFGGPAPPGFTPSSLIVSSTAAPTTSSSSARVGVIVSATTTAVRATTTTGTLSSASSPTSSTGASSTDSQNSNSSASNPILAPAIAGGVALIIIIVALTCLLMRRNRTRRGAAINQTQGYGNPLKCLHPPPPSSNPPTRAQPSHPPLPGPTTNNTLNPSPLPSPPPAMTSVGYPATVVAAASSSPPSSANQYGYNNQPPLKPHPKLLPIHPKLPNHQQQPPHMSSSSNSVVSSSDVGLMSAAAAMGTTTPPPPLPTQPPSPLPPARHESHPLLRADLADELELVKGQEMVILRAFDDGWGLGLVPSTGAQGAFPLVCVSTGASSSSESDGESLRAPQDRLSALMSHAGVGSLGTGVGRRASSRNGF
ncbi:hypothetical protein BC829DRAFT_491728 [Chytridium lagenaria]|nr:hypothetical protein BC829DRAFT_491728 [Chytridium lagenaria]